MTAAERQRLYRQRRKLKPGARLDPLKRGVLKLTPAEQRAFMRWLLELQLDPKK